MRKIIAGCVFAAGLAGAGVAYADAGLGIGVKAGTLGAGVELTKSLSPSFNVRLGMNEYKFTSSGTKSGTDYNMDLKWASSDVLLDWHPFQGSFRLTGGYLFNSNKIDLNTPQGGAYSIGSLSGTLQSGEYVKGEVKFDSGPYLGFGWGNAGDSRGFGLSFEVGAVYQGSPKVSLATSNTLGGHTVSATDVATAETNASNALSSFKWYPQVALGLSYAF